MTLVSSGAWVVGWDFIFHRLIRWDMEFAIASCRFDDVKKVVFLTSAVQSPMSEKLRFRTTTPRYFLWAERRGYCKKFRVYSLYIEIASSPSWIPWIENFRHHSFTLRNTNLQYIPIIQSIPLAKKKKAWPLCSFKPINMRFSNILMYKKGFTRGYAEASTYSTIQCLACTGTMSRTCAQCWIGLTSLLIQRAGSR